MEAANTATAPAPASRRDRRRSASKPRRRFAIAPAVAVRALVVSALAVGTIGMPAYGAIAPSAPSPAVDIVSAGGPSAYSVLSADAADTTPTSLLAPLPELSRDAVTVSRSVERIPLQTCDPSVDPNPQNGQIPTDDLCLLWDGVNMLRSDAAVAMSALNEDFVAAMGEPLCFTDSYRTLAVQQRLAYTKPGLAAAPGTSNHGWGLAVDLCSSVTNKSAAISWLTENGPTYGWANPEWARAGGSGAYEPWHWEYVPGTEAMGTSWN